MYEAARIGDQVAHTCWLEGIVVGLAVGALVVASGGTAAPLLIAVAAGAAGGAAGAAVSILRKNKGPIRTGAATVLIGRKNAARAVIDEVTCHPGNHIAEGSKTVGIERKPAARIEDKTECDGTISQGIPTVQIGKEPDTYLPIKNEIPWQVRLILGGVMAAGGVNSARNRFKSKTPPVETPNTSRNSKCTKFGEPVDVATGNVVATAIDLSLPGLIPVVWTRNYCSAQAKEKNAMGAGGWTHSFEQFIVREEARWTLRIEDGRDVYFEPVDAGQSTFHRRERLTLGVEPDGSFWVYSLDTRLTRYFTKPLNNGRVMLQSIRDTCGNDVTLYYDLDRLCRVVDTAGRQIHVISDPQGRIMKLELWARNERHREVEYLYHSSGELASVTNALGFVDRYAYDAQHRLTRNTWKNGVSFHYEYDVDSGRCVKTWGDDNLHAGTLHYNIEHQYTEIRNTEEPRIYYWNNVGRVVQTETTDGQCLRQSKVDADGYVLAEGNTEAELTRYEYDNRGNRTKLIDAAGNVTLWQYANDLPTERIGADGLITQYVHDERGALVGVTYPSGVRYALTYDLHGRLSAVRDGDHSAASFVYDKEHNVIRELDARGEVTDYTYGPTGKPIERKDPLGQLTRVEYDRLGHPVAIHRPDGTISRAEYGPLGKPSRVIDALGQITELAYAGTGALSRLVQPDGNAWSMVYDRGERLTKIRNPAHEVYSYDYDEAGRVISERTFDGRTLRYQYNEVGRLASIEQPDNNCRFFRYDKLGKIIGDRSFHSNVEFERDKLGRLMKAVLQERSGKVITEFRRDEFGRIIEEMQNGQAIRYSYDDHGRRIERVLPDGSTTRYGYDIVDALAHVEHDGRRFELERDRLGREVSRKAVEGRFEIRSAYDEMDRLVERHVAGGAAHAALSGRTWKYDALGRVREIGDSRWGGTVYQYDSIGQLIEAKRGSYHEVFQYDVTGSLRNILQGLTSGGQARAWDTRPGNLLTRTEKARYEYDVCGRRTKKVELTLAEAGRSVAATTTYVWDERDRLREVNKPDGARVLFTYDAFGRRVRKEVLPGEGQAARRVAEFLWDGDVLAADIDNTRGTRVFVHEPGTFIPMLQAEQGEVFAVVNDHLGMPKELVAQDGRVAWSAAHSAWGKVIEEYRDSARKGRPVESPFRLLGQYADDETGLCYTRFRYFDSETGRWCSSDPLGIFAGTNLLGFDQAPTVDADPLGLAGGRRGNEATRSHLEQVRDQFLKDNPDYRHVAGGRDANTRQEIPEEYIRGRNGAGGSYSDLTFEDSQGNRVRINSVDTKGGVMTDREAINAQRIGQQTGEPIYTVPKGEDPSKSRPWLKGDCP